MKIQGHCLGPGLGFLRPCLKKNFRLLFSPNQLLPFLSLMSENVFLDNLTALTRLILIILSHRHLLLVSYQTLKCCKCLFAYLACSSQRTRKVAGYISQLYLLLTPSLGHYPVHLPFAMLLIFCLKGTNLGVVADAEILVLEAEMGGSQIKPGR